jgi:hypothetical protein
VLTLYRFRGSSSSSLDAGVAEQARHRGLYKAVREALGLPPGCEDLPSEVAGDVRQVLSGLHKALQGIGALRTHAEDAYRPEQGFRRIDAKIARLAIHPAGTRCARRTGRAACWRPARRSSAQIALFDGKRPADRTALTALRKSIAWPVGVEAEARRWPAARNLPLL